jgi:hypothetical protein
MAPIRDRLVKLPGAMRTFERLFLLLLGYRCLMVDYYYDTNQARSISLITWSREAEQLLLGMPINERLLS